MSLGSSVSPSILGCVVMGVVNLNTAVRSTATHTDRCGGFFWLKPVAISLVSCSKAEVVECLVGNRVGQRMETGGC